MLWSYRIFLVEMTELIAKKDMNQEDKIKAVTKLTLRQKDELKQIDMKLVLQLDQKVRENYIHNYVYILLYALICFR